MTGTMTWAAMDVHARSTYAASLDVITGELSRQRFDTGAVEPVVAWLAGLPGPVSACYEAGPTGFGLYRAAVAAGIDCQVIAPSKTPRPSGDRNKSDRRDTDLLLRQLMAGALTPVAVPSATFEAARDLARAREQVRLDLMRCRHRLSKLLLRHGRGWDRTAWTQMHRQWLGSQTFEHHDTELAFIDNLAACNGLTARREALDERLSHVATDPEFWPIVRRLRAFRGIDTLSALIITLEIVDFTRFQRAVKLGSWLGLVPSHQQSGESDVHGSITKTGSKYARRILVEAAWHCARPPRIGRTLYERQEGLPDHVLQIARRAHSRLYRIHQRMRERNKPGNVITVACARELACFLWAEQREHLKEVVLDNVANHPHTLIEPTSGGDVQVLGHRDLDLVHVLAVPDRFEERIREAEEQDVLDR